MRKPQAACTYAYAEHLCARRRVALRAYDAHFGHRRVLGRMDRCKCEDDEDLGIVGFLLRILLTALLSFWMRS